MARRLSRPSRVAMSRGLRADYFATIRSYLAAQIQIELVEIPFDETSGATDLGAIQRLADDDLLCAVTGFPTSWGRGATGRNYRADS